MIYYVSFYKGYAVISDGTVISHRGKVLKQTLSKTGYYVLYVRDRQEYVHRLLAKAFIPNPDNKPCINHIDGDKSNNKLSNLEWVTYAENTNHSFRTGMSVSGERHHSAKLTSQDVISIRQSYKTRHYGWFKDTASRYSISEVTLRDIVYLKTWRHI